MPVFDKLDLVYLTDRRSLLGTSFERYPGIEMPVLDKLDLVN